MKDIKKSKNFIFLIISLILIAIGGIILAVTSIGHKESEKVGNKNEEVSNLPEEAKKLVGRWVYVDRQGHRFIDLYSNGKGWTNGYVSGDYDGVALKWTYYDKEGLTIYTALHHNENEKHDKNGFYVISNDSITINKMQITGKPDNINGFVKSKNEVMIMRNFGDRLVNAKDCDDEYGFTDKDSDVRHDFDKFKDGKKYNIDEKGYESIDMYMQDKDAYKDNLINKDA